MGLQKELEAKNLDGVIRELTENPSCIDDVTEKGVPLALYAAELGDFSIVKYIVEYSRASMNTVDENHRNILHYAAASGNLEMNRYLVEKVGIAVAEEMEEFHIDLWLAPGLNIQRNPLCGRNFEYYSEDPFLSGTVASKEVYGAATKGLYAYIKHFAFNDQENHRGDREGQYGAATWLNEQSAREIYLKPFEMCMKLDDITLNYVEKQADGSYQNAETTIPAAMGVMTAFNRIGATWTGGSYALITGILRTEWGFNGAVITDNANTGVFMLGQQMIEAGADMKLTYDTSAARWDNYDANDPETYHYAREALHHVLYTTANTKAMNHAMPGSVYKDGPQIATVVRTVVNILCTLLLVFFAYRIFRVWKPSKRKLAKLEAKAAAKANKA